MSAEMVAYLILVDYLYIKRKLYVDCNRFKSATRRDADPASLLKISLWDGFQFLLV